MPLARPPGSSTDAPHFMDEIKVFFRDDDLGPASDALRTVTELLVEAEVPCSYQVVPLQLDDAGADLVRSLKQARPELVAFHQHGLRHQQDVGGETRWSEFDAGRPYEAQLEDIAEGRRQLIAQLGPALDPSVFTPPCHKYDDATLRALRELGFTTLSAGVRADPASRLYYATGRALRRVGFLGGRVSYHGRRTPETGLAEVSVAVDVDEAVDLRGRKITKDAARLWREFEASARHLPWVGIMLHHEKYVDSARTDTLREFVARLKADPRVRFASLTELAAACSA